MQSSGQASFPIIEKGLLLFKVEHMHTGSHVNLLLLETNKMSISVASYKDKHKGPSFFSKNLAGALPLN